MLGTRLKELRGKITQEEVAEKIGVSRARYSHYENSRSEPDTEILNKLADYFKVSTDYLLGRTDDPSPIQREIIKHDDEDELEKLLDDPEVGIWAKEWSESSEENRKIALDLLRRLNEVEKGRKPGDRQK